MVLFSCKSENKTIFVSKANPVFRKDLIALGDEFYAAKESNLLSQLTILGALDSQIEPCHCFMRPFGGLKRIGNYLARSKSPLVISGPLTQPNVEGPVSPALLNAELPAFFLRTRPVAVAFDIVDLPFWKQHRVKLKAVPLVASNLEWSDAKLRADLNVQSFVDVKFGDQTFRFFYFVSKSAVAHGLSVIPAEKVLSKLVQDTPPEIVPVLMSDTIDEVRELLRKETRPLFSIASWTISNSASVETEKTWTKVFVERRTRSVAHIQWPAKAALTGKVFVDVASLERRIDLYNNTLKRVVEESRASKDFKETDKGYEIPKSEAGFFRAFDYELPNEKVSKIPLKLDHVNLTEAYDK